MHRLDWKERSKLGCPDPKMNVLPQRILQTAHLFSWSKRCCPALGGGGYSSHTHTQLLSPPSWRRNETEKPKRKICRILLLSVPVLRTPLEAWLCPQITSTLRHFPDTAPSPARNFAKLKLAQAGRTPVGGTGFPLKAIDRSRPAPKF